MLRTITRLGPISISGLLPLKLFDDHDKVKDLGLVKDLNMVSEDLTGMDRVRMIFNKSDYGDMSDELNFIIQSSIGAGLFGAMYGGVKEGQKAYYYFMEQNEASLFENKHRLERALQDKVTLSFAKGAFKFGWRLALFTFVFTLTSKVVQVYRGEISMYEYLAAGWVTGGIYRVNMGLRGFVAGSTLGAALGSVVGGITLLLLRASGASMGDLLLWQHQIVQQREKKLRENKKGKTTKIDPILLPNEEKMNNLNTTQETEI